MNITRWHLGFWFDQYSWGSGIWDFPHTGIWNLLAVPCSPWTHPQAELVFPLWWSTASTCWRFLPCSLSRCGISLRLKHLHLAIDMYKECLSCQNSQWRCSQYMQRSLWDISADQLIGAYSIWRWLTLPGGSFLESSAERSKIVVKSLQTTPAG